MFFHGGDHLGATLALADHTGQTLLNEDGAVGIHSVGGGGAGRADSLAGLGGGRSDKVDNAVTDIHG